MSTKNQTVTSRREFLKTSGTLVATSALAGLVIPKVYAAGSDMIQVALIGCGHRGTDAAHQALSTTSGPIKLVAMADIFENRLTASYNNLKRKGDLIDVPEDRKFLGFDAYKQAMDCLKPGDVAIFATPSAFRWVHFGYAIQKNLNVFMEKPVAVDGPTSKRMFQLGEESVKKKLKVGVGLMCRHCKARHELADRIKQGEIGDILFMRAYRMHAPISSFCSLPKPADKTDDKLDDKPAKQSESAKQLADAGKTILVTIHQPSLEAFEKFDAVAVIARDESTNQTGRLAWFGRAYPDAITFFEPRSSGAAVPTTHGSRPHCLAGAGHQSGCRGRRSRSSPCRRSPPRRRACRTRARCTWCRRAAAARSR
jgi:hypothetical protein